MISNSIEPIQYEGGLKSEGNCYDNVCIESFHSILKKMIYLEKFKTRGAHIRVHYIFYNAKYIHSTIGYITPNECKLMYQNSLIFSILGVYFINRGTLLISMCTVEFITIMKGNFKMRKQFFGLDFDIQTSIENKEKN